MTWRGLPREIVLWVPVGLAPILNGAIRMLLYARWLGEPRASVLSSALDVLVVSAYACLAQRLWPVERWGGSVGRGLVWLALTTLNHFVLGAFVFGISLPGLLAKYNVLDGEMWPVVSLAIFAAPLYGTWKVTPPTERDASARPS